MTSAAVWLERLEAGRAAYFRNDRTPIEDLDLRLREAATWCARRSASALRTFEVMPLPASRRDSVDDVVHDRRAHLGVQAQLGRPAGRLLLYYPDANLCCGAAQAETHGFFDVFNCPPRDTWVGLFEDPEANEAEATQLLSWVPEALMDVVGKGIWVNPEECIVWFEESSSSLLRVFRETPLRTWLTTPPSTRADP